MGRAMRLRHGQLAGEAFIKRMAAISPLRKTPENVASGGFGHLTTSVPGLAQPGQISL